MNLDMLHFCGQTHKGLLAQQNQDAFIFAPDLAQAQWNQAQSLLQKPALGSLLAIADGTGNDKVAAFALQTLQKMFRIKELPDSQKAILDMLRESIRLTHQEIIQNERLKSSATTLVLAWIIDKKIFLAWSGDSRAYLWRGKLQLLTDDHSLVWQKVKEKKMTPEQARLSPDNHIIFQCLGSPDLPPMPDTLVLDWQEGDRFLLCTDGISTMLPHEDLEKIVAQSIDAPTCCQNLIEACNQAGGHDNMTAIVADFGEVNPENSQAFIKEVLAQDPVKEVVLTGLLVASILVVFLFGFLFANYLTSLNQQEKNNEQRLQLIKKEVVVPPIEEQEQPSIKPDVQAQPIPKSQNETTKINTTTENAKIFDTSKNEILEQELKKVLDQKEFLRQQIAQAQPKIVAEKKAEFDKIESNFKALWSKKLKNVCTPESKFIRVNTEEEWLKSQKIIDEVAQDLKKLKSELQKIQ